MFSRAGPKKLFAGWYLKNVRQGLIKSVPVAARREEDSIYLFNKQ
jgi:hypothetical protein